MPTYNGKILDDLHAEFLAKPPKPEQVTKLIREYQREQAALDKLNAECLRAQKAIVALGAKRAERRSALDQLSKQLVRSLGRVPVVIGKVTYDFAATGERVYLVPRKVRK